MSGEPSPRADIPKLRDPGAISGTFLIRAAQSHAFTSSDDFNRSVDQAAKAVFMPPAHGGVENIAGKVTADAGENVIVSAHRRPPEPWP